MAFPGLSRPIAAFAGAAKAHHAKGVLGCGKYGKMGIAGPLRRDHRLTFGHDRISPLTVNEETMPPLPPPVAAFIRAANSFHLDGLLASFADDALVNDQQRQYLGKTEIRRWAGREIVGDKMTMSVTRAVERYGDVVVTANVGGEFDKAASPDPLVLDFYFSLRADKIVQLIILHNRRAY